MSNKQFTILLGVNVVALAAILVILTLPIERKPDVCDENPIGAPTLDMRSGVSITSEGR